MKFLSLFTVITCTLAASIPLRPVLPNPITPVRDDSATPVANEHRTITRQVEIINGALVNLTKAAGEFTGDDQSQVALVLGGFAMLFKYTQEANYCLSNTPRLGLIKSLTISRSLLGFGNNVTNMVAAILKAKPKLVAAGIRGEMYTAMLKEKDISKIFHKTVTIRLYESFQKTAISRAKPIFAALDEGVAAFADMDDSTVTAPEKGAR